MIDFKLYLLFILTGFIAAAAPGPSNLFAVSQSMVLGFRNAIPSTLGLLSGSIFYGIFTLLSTAFLLKKYASTSHLIKIIGVAILLYLAIKKIFFNSRKLIIKEEIQKNTPWKDYMIGLITTLASPKVMLFYLVYIAAFISPKYPLYFQLSLLVTTQFLIKLLVLFSYSFMASKINQTLQSNGYVQITQKLSGILLFAIALFLLFIN